MGAVFRQPVVKTEAAALAREALQNESELALVDDHLIPALDRVGEGYEVLRQTEQCWANNAIHLTASSGGRLIYGIFNREMEDFEIGPGKGQ